MKLVIAYALILFGIIGLLSLNSSPLSQGPHGGILKKSEEYYIEMKNDPDTSLLAYLLSKKLKTISNKAVSGEAKLLFPDSTALNIPVKAGSNNSFTAKTPPGFYACTVTFLVFGKKVSARFEKEDQTAQKK